MVKINGSDITTVRGDTTSFNLVLRDASGYIISDSSYIVRFSVKASYSDSIYIIGPLTVTNSKVSVPASIMTGILPGRYVYDIEVVDSSTSNEPIVTTVQRGKFIVLPDITR